MKYNDDNLFYFQWHITDKCNLDCKHCYQNHPDNFKDIEYEKLQIIADIIDSACKKWETLCEIAITGGEPFSRKNDLLNLLKYIEKKENIARVDILSNGILIDSDIIKEINKLKKLNSIQVSIDGYTQSLHEAIRGKNTFEKTIETIKRLKENNIKVSVMMTLNKTNYQHIDETYALLQSLNVDYFAVDRFIPEKVDAFGFNKNALSGEELKEAYEKVKILSERNSDRLPKLLPYRPLFCLLNNEGENALGASCSAGFSSLTILPDGTVLPCRRLPIPIGNIFQDGIYKIWYDSKLLWSLRNGDSLTEKCRVCEHVSECRGCRATAYAVSDNYLGEDPLCWKK